MESTEGMNARKYARGTRSEKSSPTARDRLLLRAAPDAFVEPRRQAVVVLRRVLALRRARAERAHVRDVRRHFPPHLAQAEPAVSLDHLQQGNCTCTP